MKTFHIETDDQRQNLFKFLSARDLPFQVEFGPIREQRSLNQNSRLWKLHELAAKETGHTAEEMHEFALCRHFGSTEKTCAGMVQSVPNKRSSVRDKKEFSEFMEATEAWYVQEFGIWLGDTE